MKYTILASIIFLSSSIYPGYSSEKQDQKMISIVHSQNILIHRIMKSYMKLGAGIGLEKEIRALDNDIADFEENLYTLYDLSKGSNIEEQIEEVLIHWYKFRLMAISLPSNFDAPIFMFRGQEIIKKLSSAIYLNKTSTQKSKRLAYFSKLLETSIDIPMYYYANRWGWGSGNDKASKESWIYQLYIEKVAELGYLLKDKSIISRENNELKNTYSQLKEKYKLSIKNIENKSNTEILISLENFDQEFIKLCQITFNDLLALE